MIRLYSTAQALALRGTIPELTITRSLLTAMIQRSTVTSSSGSKNFRISANLEATNNMRGHIGYVEDFLNG